MSQLVHPVLSDLLRREEPDHIGSGSLAPVDPIGGHVQITHVVLDQAWSGYEKKTVAVLHYWNFLQVVPPDVVFYYFHFFKFRFFCIK